MLILPLWLTICLNAMAVKSRLAVPSGGSRGWARGARAPRIFRPN